LLKTLKYKGIKADKNKLDELFYFFLEIFPNFRDLTTTLMKSALSQPKQLEYNSKDF